MDSVKIKECCLTIAGSDSGGNAGVQADLRAFHTYGLHGCTVFTAMTAQNPFGVSAIHNLPSDFIAAELDSVLGVYSIRALKTGMLSSPEIIETVADKLVGHDEIAKVIDPVMVATSGARLISEEAVDVLVSRLIPQAAVITPNLPEAHVLAGHTKYAGTDRSDTAETAKELARILNGEFGCSVLVKGGHGSGSSAVDVLFDGSDFSEYSMPWIANPVSTHGTGCSLAAALASELALGRTLKDAVTGAKRYVYESIRKSYLVGPDCGVLGFPGFES